MRNKKNISKFKSKILSEKSFLIKREDTTHKFLDTNQVVSSLGEPKNTKKTNNRHLDLKDLAEQNIKAWFSLFRL